MIPVLPAPVRLNGRAPVEGPPAEPAPPAASPPGVRSGASLRSVVEIVGMVAAPTTIVTGLALYFGVVYVNAQAFYFGIDGSTLGFSTQDYLLRSADALFVPLGGLVLAGLVLLCCYAGFEHWLRRPDRRALVDVASWVMTVGGAALFAMGVTAVFRPLPFRTPFLVPPLSLGVGILAWGYAGSLRRRPGASSRVVAARTALVGMMVVVSLFWAASEYARALGRGRSGILEANLPARPGVVVYSAQRLHAEGTGVREIELPGSNDGYRYRYDGLRLFIRSGGRFFLLPKAWTPSAGRAVVIVDDERVRVEFTVGDPS